MATTVNSINSCDGAITLASSVPSILGVSNNPTAPFTITLAPINANVASLNGKLGSVVLASPDNTLAFTTPALGSTINISGYKPTGSGGAGSALLQAQNLTGALAWDGATVAYTPGAVVIHSGETYVCLVAQPIGSVAPVNGANWQSIGGGGGPGGSSITGGGATVACDDPSATCNITLTTSASGSTGDLNIDTSSGVSGAVSIKTIGDMTVDTTANGNAGMIVKTYDTLSYFDRNTTDNPGESGQIKFVSNDATHPGELSIGGVPNPGGLYVSNTQLLFNNVPVLNNSQIVNGGSTLALDTVGSLTLTTTDVASNANQITLTTTVPTTTPPVGAGTIAINSGNNVVINSAGVITLDATGQVVIFSEGDDVVIHSGAGGIRNLVKPDAYLTVEILPDTGYTNGTIPFYNFSAIWNNTSGYSVGCVVAIGSLTAPTASYVCRLTVAPVDSPAVNPDPSVDTTHWLPFGGALPTQITNAGASVVVDTDGRITSTTTGSGDYIVQTKTGSALGHILLSANGANNAGDANINILNASYGRLRFDTGAQTLVADGGNGSSLALDDLGSLTFTTNDVASNANKITLTTTVPTTTPLADAGKIAINSGRDVDITSAGNVNITSVGAIILDASRQVSIYSEADDVVIHSGAGDIRNLVRADGSLTVEILPDTGYTNGTIPFYDITAVWNNTSGYTRGCVVAIGSLTAPIASYVCILAVAPVESPTVNPDPSVDTTHWLPSGGSVGLQMAIGFNNPITWTNATTPPTSDGILIADVSYLIPLFGYSIPPPQFPALNLRVGTVVCGYGIDKATDPFPATGTLFIYLSADNSALNADGAFIVQCIPFSNVAELVNDLDTNTPSSFTVSTFGSFPSTITSLRLMAYYSAPTEASWSVVLSLGAIGVQPINTRLFVPS